MSDSLVSKEDRTHLAKAELIEKLSPYYEAHESSLFDKLSAFSCSAFYFTTRTSSRYCQDR